MANSVSDQSESVNEVENMLQPHQSHRRPAPGSSGWGSSKAQPTQQRGRLFWPIVTDMLSPLSFQFLTLLHGAVSSLQDDIDDM